MPKINLETGPIRKGSGYPPPFNEPCMGRSGVKLSDAGGLTQFGANLMTLAPGAWSSQRHYHTHEDELVYIISGHPVLIDDSGETQLSPGDVTAHPAGIANGHHMINRSKADVVYLVVGSRRPEVDSGHYPDIDLAIPANGSPDRIYTQKNGRAY